MLTLRIIRQRSNFSLCKRRMKSTNCKSQYLDLKAGRRIFVDHLEGLHPQKPCVIYVPGFLSHRQSEKGKSLYEYCANAGYEFIRYDPEGFGNSQFKDPEKWRDIEFRHWFEDCEAAMKISKNKSFILVGSSMGGWISLLVQKKLTDQIAGMVLIAPAQNFIARMVADGKNLIDDPLIESLVDVKSFSRKSEELSISLKPNSNEINVPVRILHGMKDDIIPSESSVKLIHSIQGNDTELTLIKSGDHQLNDYMNKITGHLEILMQKSSLGLME